MKKQAYLGLNKLSSHGKQQEIQKEVAKRDKGGESNAGSKKDTIAGGGSGGVLREIGKMAFHELKRPFMEG